MVYRTYKFNSKEAEHEIEEIKLRAKLDHPFALKMATLICLSVVSSIILLGIFFGAKTPMTIGIIMVVALVLGIISFSVTRSACL